MKENLLLLMYLYFEGVSALFYEQNIMHMYCHVIIVLTPVVIFQQDFKV